MQTLLCSAYCWSGQEVRAVLGMEAAVRTLYSDTHSLSDHQISVYTAIKLSISCSQLIHSLSLCLIKCHRTITGRFTCLPPSLYLEIHRALHLVFIPPLKL